MKNKYPKIIFTIICFIIFFNTCLFGQFTWTGNGDITNWYDPNNWNTNNIPTAFDNCIIPFGVKQPNLIDPGIYDCADLTINAKATLDIQNGVTLNVSGDLSASGNITTNDASKLYVTGKADFSVVTINVGSEIEVDGASTFILGVPALNIIDGTFDANGSFDGSGITIDMESGSNLTLAGTVISLGTLDAAAGTVTYDDEIGVNAAQDVLSDIYFNLIIDYNNASIISKAPTGDITCNGDFTELPSSGIGIYYIGKYIHLTYGSTDINEQLYITTGTYDANGSFDATGGNIRLAGAGRLELSSKVTSLGNFSTTAGTVKYDGSSAQSIDQPETFYNLELSNSSGLTLDDDISVEGTLILNNGIISTQTNSIQIKSSPIGGSASSHINGICKLYSSAVATSAIKVPVGNGTIYRPVFLEPTTTAPTTYVVEFNNSNHSSMGDWVNYPTGAPVDEGSGLNHIAIGYWWNISRSGGSPAYVGVNWDNTMEVDAPNDMLLAHYNGTTQEWYSCGGTMTGPDGIGEAKSSGGRVMSLSALDDFSPFGPGSGSGGNPFPIDLLSFTSTCSNDIVDVNFTVNSQINNDYFIIERSSDAIDWEAIAVINGVGNSNVSMEYSFVDTDPLSGLAYYRLTQVDFDGVFETFYPVSTDCGSEGDGLPILVYPNPITDEFSIELELENYQGDNVYFMMFDLRGSIVMREHIELNRGFNKHVIDVKSLPFGSYVLRFENTKEHISEKRIVIK